MAILIIVTIIMGVFMVWCLVGLSNSICSLEHNLEVQAKVIVTVSNILTDHILREKEQAKEFAKLKSKFENYKKLSDDFNIEIAQKIMNLKRDELKEQKVEVEGLE